MSDVNQVRINELARELEVKAKAIIDLLAGYGVTEKKTHSSSIPPDVAEKVRKHLQGVAAQAAPAEAKTNAEKATREAAATPALSAPATTPGVARGAAPNAPDPLAATPPATAPPPTA